MSGHRVTSSIVHFDIELHPKANKVLLYERQKIRTEHYIFISEHTCFYDIRSLHDNRKIIRGEALEKKNI